MLCGSRIYWGHFNSCKSYLANGEIRQIDWWRALAIASAAVSLLLVVIFGHPCLIVGLLIDAAVLVTLLFTKWSPG